MKIGILTFHTPINYGAVFQAYALQKYLKINMPEHSISIIDFQTKKHLSEYKIFSPFRRNIILYLFNQLCILYRYPAIKRRKLKFQYFLKTELDLTRKYPTQEEFLTKIQKMDVYIVGSDQVFHPKAEYLRAYYLDFKKGNSKKIAYAPSFGMSDFDEEIRRKISPMITDFDALSCRENDGANFLQEITKKNIPTVLDPVFLLNNTQWSSISIESKISAKYIFIYDLNGKEHLIKIALKIKEVTGWKIICQTQAANKFYQVDQQIFDCGPREFIGLVKNAEYIVTDSFHGTAFSILFNKPQSIYIAMPKAATRIYSLLAQLGLTSRIIENGMSDRFVYEKSDKKIDYSLKLNELISKSAQFLMEAIKPDNQVEI